MGLDHLHEVGGEDALRAVDLPTPPRIRVIALLGDDDNLTFAEGEVARLRGKV